MIEELQRRARDENGNTILVPQMSYEEWKKQYKLSDEDNKILKVKKDIKEIKNATKKILPNKFLKELDFVKVKRFEGKYNYYDLLKKEIRLGINADEYSLIHELAHVFETKIELYKDKNFGRILKSKFEKYKKSDFELIKHDGGDYYRLKNSDDFVSSYQTRIYKNFFSFDRYGNVNCKYAREYFSEGLKYFYKSPELLFRKDKELYRFIRDLMWRYD